VNVEESCQNKVADYLRDVSSCQEAMEKSGELAIRPGLALPHLRNTLPSCQKALHNHIKSSAPDIFIHVWHCLFLFSSKIYSCDTGLQPYSGNLCVLADVYMKPSKTKWDRDFSLNFFVKILTPATLLHIIRVISSDLRLLLGTIKPSKTCYYLIKVSGDITLQESAPGGGIGPMWSMFSITEGVYF